MAPGLLLEEAQRVLSGQMLLSPCRLAPSPWQSVAHAFTDEDTEAQQGVGGHVM